MLLYLLFQKHETHIDMENTPNILDKDLSLEDIFKGNVFEDKDEPLWDKLIQQIIEGNVVPVIGADLLIDNELNLHQFIIDFFAKGFNLKSNPKSFSELIFDPVYKVKNKKDSVYYHVNTIFAKNRFPASKKLKKLLSIRQFPFVITTSFSPIVEQVMSEIWRDELKVMKFNNNPSENEDIKGSIDLRKPTVYYMFGKVGDGAHKYALTDTDMLDFCSSWLSNDGKMRPKNLCNELKDKYLLMLGNNYSDWLFRFIWYSMRKSNMGNGMMTYDSVDESLINFLERAEAFTKQNPSEVISQILERLERKLAQSEQIRFNKPGEDMDVFISYSRRDSHIADKLYKILTSQGKRVWYDKNNLTDGGNFKEEIHKAIRTAKYFIPILSNNIIKEKNESHVYRNEWDWAIDIAISMGRTYIIPLAEYNFDFYNASIPEKMQQHNAIFYTDGDEMTSVAEKIIHKMNQD